MKRIKFKNISLYSEIEEGAAEFSFSDSFTIIRGTNSVGKSRIIKSLFSSFGAETKNPEIWKKAKTYTLVEFTIDDIHYFILEHSQRFSLFSQDGTLIKSFLNVGDFTIFLNELLGISVKLFDLKEKETFPLYPGHLFMPFYIDQDTGWQNNWSSFLRVNFLKDWKNSVIDYFVGIRDNQAFILDEKITRIENSLQALELKLENHNDILKRIEEKSTTTGFTIDINKFKTDLDSLLKNSAALNKEQEKIRAALLGLKNEFVEVDLSLEIAQKTKKILSKNFDSLKDTSIINFPCPVCGTEHQNSFISRLKLAEEEDTYNTLISDLLLKRDSLQKRIVDGTLEIENISDKISAINEILETQKDEFTLNDFIKSEGERSYKLTIKEEMEALRSIISKDRTDLELLRKAKRENLKQNDKSGILKKYSTVMYHYSKELDATEDEDIMENIYARVKQTGSDGIRSLLAYFFTVLYLINENNDAIFCPIVIDTPNQQDQDRVSLNKILNLIRTKTPKNSQIIIGLTNTEEMDLTGVKVIQLEEPKRQILRKENYATVKSKILPFIDQHVDSLLEEIEKRESEVS